jgi:(2Fe-2S) ferredoxin
VGGVARVRMCRGCCCGTRRKHPDVDHDAIVDVLVAGLAGVADVVTTDCLSVCDLSNVVVVSPTPGARRRGARPAWVTHVNTVHRAALVVDWVRAGGPGASRPPEGLGEVRTALDLRPGGGPTS